MPFVISNGQIGAFQEDARTRYVRSLVKFLQDEVPGAAGDGKEYLFEFTWSMINKAEGYGLKTQRDVAVYVTAAYLLGQDFEDHFHVAKQVLTSSLPGPDKANWLQNASVALIDSREASPII